METRRRVPISLSVSCLRSPRAPAHRLTPPSTQGRLETELRTCEERTERGGTSQTPAPSARRTGASGKLPQTLPPLLSLPFLLLLLFSSPTPTDATKRRGRWIRNWVSSRATFYGGLNAAGTMGGACGYGDLYQAGYGTMTAAASIAMWEEGAVCGSCWEVECVESKWCIPGAKVTVTITNQCPQGSEGGWCNRPHQHLDMAYPAWAKIAKDPIAGVVKTRMRRVPCPKKGGILISLNGHSFWTQITIMNVAGPGDLRSVRVSRDAGRTWGKPLRRIWGGVFSSSGLMGRPLSFRLRARATPKTINLINCVPGNWQPGRSYRCSGNF